MLDVFALLLSFPSLLLIANLLVPSRWANRQVRWYRMMLTTITAVQFLIAATFTALRFTAWSPFSPDEVLPFAGAYLTVYFDGVSSLMLTLVSFIGWVFCGYSIRYLDGEATQGRYFRWGAVTIGSVSLMVIAGNLMLCIACWVMTGLGLHALLLHYGHRPAARRAAWTRFTVSRLGDFALVLAAILIYWDWETLDFPGIFEASASIAPPSTAITIAVFLISLGAITRSAQFPFHTWLPQTMESPTPVSALMHAGIVNAGGYLIVRTSPLVSLAPSALTVLAIVGTITACGGAIIMLTQTSVKRSLAYSTIAQMGFMFLQCGLGAYSAAMLHILAHSLYKAYAFLSSGSVLSERSPRSTAGDKHNSSHPSMSLFGWVGVPVAVAGCLLIAFLLFKINPLTKPGGLPLGGILTLALTHWVWRVIAEAKALPNSTGMVARSLGTAAALCLAYVTCFCTVDKIVAGSLPTESSPRLGWLIAMIVIAGFACLMFVQRGLRSSLSSATAHRLRVHVANGFYLEGLMRRVFGSLATR